MAPVTTARILDLIAEACERVSGGDASGDRWVFTRMTAHERVAFDLFLVRTGDELAYRAGSVESRFFARVRRMVGG